MAQFAVLIYEPGDPDWSTLDTEDKQQTMTEYGAFGQSVAAVMRGGAALYPTTTATTLRQQGGEIVTSDGPYAETKEVLTGFYLLECADLDEAMQHARRVPAVRNGSIEVRPVIDFGATG